MEVFPLLDSEEESLWEIEDPLVLVPLEEDDNDELPLEEDDDEALLPSLDEPLLALVPLEEDDDDELPLEEDDDEPLNE